MDFFRRLLGFYISYDTAFICHGSTFEVLPAVTLYKIAEDVCIIDLGWLTYTLTITLKFVKES